MPGRIAPMKLQARGVTSCLPSSLCPTRAPGWTQRARRSHTGHEGGGSLGSLFLQLSKLWTGRPPRVGAGAPYECPVAAITNYHKPGAEGGGGGRCVWLKTAEICSFTVLGPKSLKSRCWQGRAPCKDTRGESYSQSSRERIRPHLFPAFLAPSDPWHSLACSYVTPISASIFM